MGIHLLYCAHGNERNNTHDAINDIFVAIMRDADFHVGQKQLHALLSTTSIPLFNELTLCSQNLYIN
jgi:hypothetical protein